MAAETNLTFSDNPADRTVCGISSGGICAFSAAWFAPHSFGRVISHCGSFTNIRGGHNFPYLVQSTPRKDLRVFLQSGVNDAQTLFGDWPTANQAMAKALAYAGYDFRFEFAIDGKVTSWDKETWQQRLKPAQRVVQVVTLLDDPDYTKGETKDVELAFRITGCGRRKSMKLTHVYWS